MSKEVALEDGLPASGTPASGDFAREAVDGEKWLMVRRVANLRRAKARGLDRDDPWAASSAAKMTSDRAGPLQGEPLVSKIDDMTAYLGITIVLSGRGQRRNRR